MSCLSDHVAAIKDPGIVFVVSLAALNGAKKYSEVSMGMAMLSDKGWNGLINDPIGTGKDLKEKATKNSLDDETLSIRLWLLSVSSRILYPPLQGYPQVACNKTLFVMFP